MSPAAGCRLYLFAALLPLLVCGCLIFQPQSYPEGDWNPADPVFEDAWFTSADEVSLHGWFAQAAHPRAVVLYAHGNAGNVTQLHSVLRFFRDELHTSMLVFDYRGYGRSEGDPDEPGILADARAARRWLAGRAGVAERDIVLVGRSLAAPWRSIWPPATAPGA